MSKGNKTIEYPEVLAEVIKEVSMALIESGCEESKAVEIGFKSAERVRIRFGGDHVYIPKGDAFSLSRRNEIIISEFNGTNRKALCRKYGISEVQFYKIIASSSARRQRR